MKYSEVERFMQISEIMYFIGFIELVDFMLSSSARRTASFSGQLTQVTRAGQQLIRGLQ